MEILLNSVSQYGNFDLKATDGFKIIHFFTDYESGLLVVSEIALDDEKKTSKPLYNTLIDTSVPKILTTEDLQNIFNYGITEATNDELQIKSITQRIHEKGKSDFFEEKLVSLADNKVLLTSQSVAFYDKKRKTIIERYKSILEEKKEENRFWEEEYPNMSFEARKVYWHKHFYYSVKWQGEAGLEESTAFTEQNYRSMLEKEPQIDEIIQDFFEKHLDYPEGWQNIKKTYKNG